MRASVYSANQPSIILAWGSGLCGGAASLHTFFSSHLGHKKKKKGRGKSEESKLWRGRRGASRESVLSFYHKMRAMCRLGAAAVVMSCHVISWRSPACFSLSSSLAILLSELNERKEPHRGREGRKRGALLLRFCPRDLASEAGACRPSVACASIESRQFHQKGKRETGACDVCFFRDSASQPGGRVGAPRARTLECVRRRENMRHICLALSPALPALREGARTGSGLCRENALGKE